MAISMYRSGISVTYTCRWLKKIWEKKCPDADTDKCLTCRYCIAEIPARDATRLLNSYARRQNENTADYNDTAIDRDH